MSPYTAMARAAAVAYFRDRTSVFFTFAFPLLFLVVFGLLFRGQSVNGAMAYINYTAPGVLAWGIGNATVFGVAFTLMHWRRDDLLRLIRRTPTPLMAVLTSRYAVALLTGLLQAALFTTVALLPVFGLHIASSWPLALPVLLFGITSFAALGLLVGCLADTPEAVAATANCVMIPMAFLSGAFYPIDLMPGWLRTVSQVLPLRYFDEGLTDAFGGRHGSAGPLLACAALSVFAVLFALTAARFFRWSNRP
ncbi:ABC transporter permease [Kitasatospora sp. GAS204B]|uniref:ABC transporter permease n=1 Tax=unclassified Kitasatospora TaxID=2633591 RepID=UPI002476BEFA|nr:ABC transporter permease [Kitasatospora sp. GAS204B]MDH6119757.1 ABC-2 type transport system permease protein [Kitasatospora sp. GAS204B]